MVLVRFRSDFLVRKRKRCEHSIILDRLTSPRYIFGAYQTLSRQHKIFCCKSYPTKHNTNCEEAIMKGLLLSLLVLTSSVVVSSQDVDAPRPDHPRPAPLTKASFAMLEARLAFANNDALRKVKEVTWECVLISPETNT